MLALLLEGRGGSEEEAGAASYPGACHGVGAGAVPQLVPVCHRPRLLSSHHVMASPRSSPGRGRPRWSGVIRDPGPPSALASTGGGPSGFRFLWHAALPSLSPHAQGGGHGQLLLGKGGHLSSGTVTL